MGLEDYGPLYLPLVREMYVCGPGVQLDDMLVAMRAGRRANAAVRAAGLAAGHAPRRAGPEPGDAALAGRDRGCHHDGNHHHPPATPGKAQGLTWRYGTLTATTLCTHGPKEKMAGRQATVAPTITWTASAL